jgi:hypothetical protein
MINFERCLEGNCDIAAKPYRDVLRKTEDERYASCGCACGRIAIYLLRQLDKPMPWNWADEPERHKLPASGMTAAIVRLKVTPDDVEPDRLASDPAGGFGLDQQSPLRNPRPIPDPDWPDGPLDTRKARLFDGARRRRNQNAALSQLAQNRGSDVDKSMPWPKSRHYIFGEEARVQALSAVLAVTV